MRLPPRLLALSPGNLLAAQPARTDAFLALLAPLVTGGLRGLVLREAGLGDKDYLALARHVRGVLGPADSPLAAWLCVHDRPHLAHSCGADGVHLGGYSLAPGALRRTLDPELALGLSTHAGDDPGTWLAADYLFHGPLYRTHKAHARAAIGPRALAEAVRRSQAPIWALGGVTPERLEEALSTGCRGVAVQSGLFGQSRMLAAEPDPMANWRSALARLNLWDR